MMTMLYEDLIDMLEHGSIDPVLDILDMERKDTKLVAQLLRESGARYLVRLRIERAHKENIELKNWSVY